MYVQVQYTDKAAVHGILPAFAHAGGCTAIQCIAVQLKGVSENLVWQRSPE